VRAIKADARLAVNIFPPSLISFFLGPTHALPGREKAFLLIST